jgi:hypothetical protein
MLEIQVTEINEHCTGSRWTASDLDQLARVIAIIAMGQAVHAALIIAELQPSEPAINHDDLKADAVRRLSIHGATHEQKDASRWHRDGLIFEAISWAAAHKETEGNALLRDPHLSSTTQGLDGLMIELDGSNEIIRATIFEDKCSEYPRNKFRDEIMPAFQTHHQNKRASELVASAAILIARRGLNGTECAKAAARVLKKIQGLPR